MFLVNSRLGLVSATLNALEARSNTSQVPLLPKLRGYFAEFLHHDYLDRLGILYLSTCVGFGYGRLTTRSRSFSRQHRITQLTQKRADPSCLRHPGRGFTYAPPYTLSLRQPPLRMSYLPASLRSLPTTHSGHRPTTITPKGSGNLVVLSIVRLDTGVASAGTGISTRCPSTTPVGLALGPDLPRED